MNIPQRLRWILPVAPMMAIAMICAVVLGSTLPLVAFVFDRWGYNADLIGLNAATGTFGILLLGPFLPGLFERFGLPRVVATSILLVMLALIAMAAMPNIVAWFLFKALLGLNLSVIWTAAELWTNLKVDDGHRGRAFSLFSLLYWLGFACGPGIIELVGVDGPLPLLIAAAVMGSGLVFLRFLPKAEGSQTPAESKLQPLRAPLWPALMVLGMAIMAGMSDGTLPALLPIFGLVHGLGESGALAILTAFVIGGVAFQWPVGLLADKVSERALAILCIGSAGLCLALLPLAVADPATRLALGFVTGGLAMSISTLGFVVVGRTFNGRLLTVMSTWFSVLYEVGATVGPVLAGGAMVRWGADGLPLTLASASIIVCALFVIAAVRTRHAAMPEGEEPRTPL